MYTFDYASMLHLHDLLNGSDMSTDLLLVNDFYKMKQLLKLLYATGGNTTFLHFFQTSLYTDDTGSTVYRINWTDELRKDKGIIVNIAYLHYIVKFINLLIISRYIKVV